MLPSQLGAGLIIGETLPTRKTLSGQWEFELAGKWTSPIPMIGNGLWHTHKFLNMNNQFNLYILLNMLDLSDQQVTCLHKYVESDIRPLVIAAYQAAGAEQKNDLTTTAHALTVFAVLSMKIGQTDGFGAAKHTSDEMASEMHHAQLQMVSHNNGTPLQPYLGKPPLEAHNIPPMLVKLDVMRKAVSAFMSVMDTRVHQIQERTASAQEQASGQSRAMLAVQSQQGIMHMVRGLFANISSLSFPNDEMSRVQCQLRCQSHNYGDDPTNLPHLERGFRPWTNKLQETRAKALSIRTQSNMPGGAMGMQPGFASRPDRLQEAAPLQITGPPREPPLILSGEAGPRQSAPASAPKNTSG